MEKKTFLLALIIFLSIGSVFSLQISPSSTNLSKGENMVVTISGTFYQPMTLSNIHLYKGNSFGNPSKEVFFNSTSLYQVDQNDYVVSFEVPPLTEAGNYSLAIEGVKYSTGTSWTNKTSSIVFTVLNNTAFASVSPAFSSPNSYKVSLEIKSLSPDKLILLYGLKGENMTNITLQPSEEKTVYLNVYGGKKLYVASIVSGTQYYYSYIYSSLSAVSNPSQVVNFSSANTTVENSTNVTNSSNSTNSTSFWSKIFGSGNSTNKTNVTKSTNATKVNGSSGALQTCEEMNLSICNSTQKCTGKFVDGLDAQCCSASCVANTSSGSSLKTIGWIILGLAAIFVLWFFKTKYSKTKKSPTKLFKSKK